MGRCVMSKLVKTGDIEIASLVVNCYVQWSIVSYILYYNKIMVVRQSRSKTV